MRSVRWFPVLILPLLLGFGPHLRAAEKAWAYRSPQKSVVPPVKTEAWVRNAIDAFILAQLDKQQLKPSPEADRPTLIRRLTYDLTGLPPTPEEVEAFVNDRSPDAYEKLVDRLLASPRYGERWATYWLDLVRFAESDGFKADDPRPAAWRYRDYVIRALNQDKAYDRFLREQLAGDELFPGDAEALIATGFLRHYADEFNAVNLEQRRQEILNDITDTTSQVVMGLTVGCAKCHDHKYDPITQEDYYRIQAFFVAVVPSSASIGKADEVEKLNRDLEAWNERTAELRQRMTKLAEPLMQKEASRRRGRFAKEYQALIDIPDEKLDPYQKQIAAMIRKQVEVEPKEVAKSMRGEVKQQWDALDKEMEGLLKEKPSAPPTALAMTDVGPVAPTTYLLKRGDWRHRGREIAPGYLSEIDDRSAELAKSDRQTTGRRSALAEWLTRREHPLTARVMVNRLWQHHFGKGIVASPNDFGTQGDAPTHPELLDWLAVEFVERGWSLKAMHRLLVTSSTYRQSTTWNAAAAKKDPGNQLLWRMNRRRLDGETLRDAMLAVGGLLSLREAGPSIYPELPAEIGVGKSVWPVTADPAERNRRSVYVFVKRNLRYPYFSIFDAPDRTETCALRHTTTTAPQALLLLNGKITLDHAQAFAERVRRDAGDEPEKIVDRAFLLALSRLPTAKEKRTLLAFLERQSTGDLCHALLNLNEFLYVD